MTTTIKNPPVKGSGNGPYTASDVASEVIGQGGSLQQAWVAAALASGIESNGTLNDKNPSSTACGLFQFLTTTWASNGGTQYAPTACQASLSQQVAVFLTASSGNNFYPWSPDLGGSYNGKPISAPGAGSPVANKIADLAAGGTLSWLGNVPAKWADSGGVVPASPTPLGPLGAGVNVGGNVNLNPFSSVTDFFNWIGSGFGIGWAAAGTIILGIAMIGLGIIFIFRKQAVKIGEAAVAA